MKRQVKRLHKGKGLSNISSPRRPSHPLQRWMMEKALLQGFPRADPGTRTWRHGERAI